MTARRLQGGLDDSTGSGEVDDSTGSGEVDDGVGSREFFARKFWQPDGLSERL
jgi:hypothetical protein